MSAESEHKPVIETLINTTALALTSFGVIQITAAGNGTALFLRGFFCILLGAGLEFFKYWGRKYGYW